MTPEVTFSAFALFNMLTMPLMMLPMSLVYVVNGVVSGQRVLKFLLAPEIEDSDGRGIIRPRSVSGYQSVEVSLSGSMVCVWGGGHQPITATSIN